MAGEKVFYTGVTTDTGPSASIWATCPWVGMDEDPNIGYRFYDNFLGYNGAGTDPWVETQLNNGTIEQDDVVAGGIVWDSIGTTNDDGVQIQMAGESWLPASRKKLWFETRLKITNTSHQFFVGLAQEDTTLFGAGVNSADNHIGFEMNAATVSSDAGKLQFYSEKATTRATIANVKTLTSGTYVKLGFIVDGVTGITLFVDGVPQPKGGSTTTAHPILPAYIPVTEMTLSLLLQSEGTTDPDMHVDWIRCAQIRTESDV